MSATCKTCIHWREVLTGTCRTVRLEDIAVKFCTAAPPQGDFRWPRTMEHHTCGCHTAVQAEQKPEAVSQVLPAPVLTDGSELFKQEDAPAAPAGAKSRRRNG